MANECRTCRHWGSPGDMSDYRTCQAITHDDDELTDPDLDPGSGLDHRQWKKLLSTEYRLSHPAATFDFEGADSGLKTRAEFGCILHRIRDPEKPGK